MIIAVDLDDTLCSRPNNVEHLGIKKYEFCTPIQKMIDIVNKLYDDGNIIYIYTSRGMKQFNGDVNKIQSELFDFTLNSLKFWNVKHHGLIIGKIYYDLIIDDKALNIINIDNLINIV